MNVDQAIQQAIAVGNSGRFDEAEQLLRAALQSDPLDPRLHANLAVALLLKMKLDPALESIRRAIEMRPNDSNSHQTLGKVMMALNRVAEATDAYRRALQLSPEDAETHGLLARALLVAGDFKRGWAEYEWRWKCASFREPRRSFAQPRWNGARAPGKTILLHHEQGYGDTIQFIRYAPLVAARCESVILECPAELVDLMRRINVLDQVVPMGSPLPAFDLHAPLMSLPLLFNTTIQTIPSEAPYLSCNRALIDAWRTRVRGDGAKFRVGVAWAGRADHPNDRNRSIPLDALAPLGDVEGVVFYSLQKWDPQQTAARPPAGLRLIDSAARLADFSDSAALIENLDLVISVDTAVVHLAGAMGKPVWTLLPFAPDFRWLLNRTDTSWYPTMTLLRQPAPGDWESPIRDIARRLRERVASGNEARP